MLPFDNNSKPSIQTTLLTLPGYCYPSQHHKYIYLTGNAAASLDLMLVKHQL
jgi:hypothetical protein